MTDGTSDHPSYRPDIDGLRAVAVLSVLVFHAFPTLLPGGFVGVDIFFVISGFLISSILLKGLERGHFSLAEFYGRRIRRIFPALAIVLAACLAFGWIGLFAEELEHVGKHVAGGAGFVSNLLLFGESGYFDSSAETKPLLHLWSLGIEEQFYVVWPLLLYVLWKLRLNVVASIAVLGLASFAWSLRTTTFDASAAFFLLQSRGWELLIGAGLSALTLRRGPIAAPRIAHALSCAGAVAIALACWLIHSGRAFPGWWALLPTVGAAFTIAAGPNAFFNKRVLSLKPLVWVGLISYPLYLWHWPLLSFARIVASKVPPASTRGLLLAATFVLASATYFFVERPLRRGGAPRVKVFALAAAVALLGGAGYAIMVRGGMPERPLAQSAAPFFAQIGSSRWEFARNKICEKRYPFPRAKQFGWWFCIQNRSKPPSVILLGDSFTNHLYPGIVSNRQLLKRSVLSIGACAVIVGRPSDPLTPRTRHPCTGDGPVRQRELIDRIVERNPSIRYAIFQASW